MRGMQLADFQVEYGQEAGVKGDNVPKAIHNVSGDLQLGKGVGKVGQHILRRDSRFDGLIIFYAYRSQEEGLGGARVQVQRFSQIRQHIRLDIHLPALLDLLQGDQWHPGKGRQIILGHWFIKFITGLFAECSNELAEIFFIQVSPPSENENKWIKWGLLLVGLL